MSMQPAIPQARQGLRLTSRLGAAFATFALLAVVPPLLQAVGEPFYISIVSRMMIYAIAALSLDLILGYGALVSFGHAAFMGIGAYVVIILTSMGVGDLAVHLVAALAAAGLFALVTGAISLRTQGIYFLMITLAFGQMAYFFFVSLSAFGGDDGMALATRSTLFGTGLIASDTGLFYAILIVLMAVFGILWRITRSRFGRVLIGTRESALRMEAVGFRVFPYQLAAYVISACICAVSGVLIANQTMYVSPAVMSWAKSGELIIMVVLGGVGNLTGAMVGALLTIGLEEGIARFTQHWKIVFGFLLLMVVLFSPGGLTALAARLTGSRGDRQ